MNNEKLKIDLCGRLPYNPKAEIYEEITYTTIVNEINLINVLSCKFKPLLFPIQSLTKEIQLAEYNNGEPFVPLKELHRLNELNEFSKNKDWLHRIFVDTVISCEFMESDGNMFSCDYAQLKYTVDTNLGTLIYSFGYNATMNRFDARDETHKRPHAVPYQLELFNLLNRWKIDYRGLINEGFAIEVNSDNNPYL